MKYIGIDGYKSDRFYMGLDENDKNPFMVISDTSEFKNEINKTEKVLIDNNGHLNKYHSQLQCEVILIEYSTHSYQKR